MDAAVRRRWVQDKNLTIPCISTAVLVKQPPVTADMFEHRTPLRRCAVQDVMCCTAHRTTVQQCSASQRNGGMCGALLRQRPLALMSKRAWRPDNVYTVELRVCAVRQPQARCSMHMSKWQPRVHVPPSARVLRSAEVGLRCTSNGT